jgi:hypothetical protein
VAILQYVYLTFSLLTWRILTWRCCVDAAVNGFRSWGRHGLRREYKSWERHGLRGEYGSWGRCGLRREYRSWGRRGLRREYGSWGRHGLRREYGSLRMHGHYPSPAMVAPGCRLAIHHLDLHTLVRFEVRYPQPSAKWQDAACGGELVAVVRCTTRNRTYSVCAKGSLPNYHAARVSPLLRNRSRRLLLGHARVAMRPIRWGCHLLLRTLLAIDARQCLILVTERLFGCVIPGDGRQPTLLKCLGTRGPAFGNAQHCQCQDACTRDVHGETEITAGNGKYICKLWNLQPLLHRCDLYGLTFVLRQNAAECHAN